MEEPKQTVSGSLPYKEMPCFWQVFTRSGGASFFCFCKLEEFYGHRGAVPVDGGCRYSLWSSALTKKNTVSFLSPSLSLYIEVRALSGLSWSGAERVAA